MEKAPSWPHAPSKQIDAPGRVIITAATYRKAPIFDSREKLDLLMNTLFSVAEEHDWKLQAWAIFPNHYHIIGLNPGQAGSIKRLTQAVHSMTARTANAIDGQPGRKVWYRCWDTVITYEESYLARLAYVHRNPERHGVVKDSRDYRWCSAKWLWDRADRPYAETLWRIKHDNVILANDFWD